MRISLLFLIAGFLFLACGSSKKVATPTPEPVDDRPAWVRGRPIINSDYIGIGLGYKSRQDYLETAKQNALNDLASEISVQIEGNSLLYSLERNDDFREEYQSTIRTRTRQDLEGFELVDSWEDENTYWVYYRLSKAKYREQQEQKRQQAVNLAKDFYQRAETANDPSSAFDLYLRSMLALSDYWGAENRVTMNGQEILIDNAAYGQLRQTAGAIGLRTVPDRIVLNTANNFEQRLGLMAVVEKNGSSRPLTLLPLSIRYPSLDGMVRKRLVTDENGTTGLNVTRVPGSGGNSEVRIMVDIRDLSSLDEKESLARSLLEGLPGAEKRVPIAVEMPALYLVTREQNLGRPLSNGGVAVQIRKALSEQGFRFVDDASRADLQLEVLANTRQGTSSNGFYVAWLDMELKLSNPAQGMTIYQGGKNNIKGVQLDFEKAGLDAFKNGGKVFEKEMAADLLEAIL